ncbi:PDZ and coiled-coil motif-containing protein [Collichthys lucidus]|uniref:PDZ and coiled-coil motif-containing protein n=1 Tax=Collichthys lucidus TaxID=240159 RepID=A0A4U5TV02_COLLU|nr:PDZ and coiled-coil motif-containing protein [Collichthys lucidus]
MSALGGCSPTGQSSGLGPGISMFRWLEVLEKEFDKGFVDVDLLLGEIDPDQVDITYEGRQKMTSLSSCFAQLCHKTQTVFQLNHKLEILVPHLTPLTIKFFYRDWNIKLASKEPP